MTPPVPPAPAKKSNVLLWILIGVGGFFALIVVVVVAAGLFLVHQARRPGGVQFKSGDGAIQIGGAAKMPTWLPDYPGSNPQTAFVAQGKDGQNGGTFIFKTKDSADHVVQYYRDQLEASGLKISTVVTSGASHVITAEDGARHHTVTVMATSRGSETSVNVTYANK
jgi:hypothetical protein